MATAGIFAHGTLLKLHDGAATYTTIAEVMDLSGPGVSVDSIEYTSHDSPSKTREFGPGLIDSGEISFTIIFQPAIATHGNSAGIVNIMKNRTVRLWQIIFPDGGGTIYGFSAFVTAFEPKEPIDDKLTADITLKIAGVITFA